MRGRNAQSAKPLRLARNEALVSTPPETKPNRQRGRWRLPAASRSSRESTQRRLRGSVPAGLAIPEGAGAVTPPAEVAGASSSRSFVIYIPFPRHYLFAKG